MEIAAKEGKREREERGKSEEIKRGDKGELHTGESSLSSPQFPVAIVARKRTSSNEILQCRYPSGAI